MVAHIRSPYHGAILGITGIDMDEGNWSISMTVS